MQKEQIMMMLPLHTLLLRPAPPRSGSGQGRRSRWRAGHNDILFEFLGGGLFNTLKTKNQKLL